MKTRSTFQNLMRRAAMMLLLAVVTTAAWAQTYTVTLTAGDGSGSDVTLNSTDNYYGESDNGSSVPNGQFFTSDGQLWFIFPDCPGSFSAPSGKVFDTWDVNGGDYSPGHFWPFWQRPDDITITAKWRDETSSSISLSIPTAINIAYGDTQTEFDIEVTAISFYDPSSSFTVNLYDGTFTCADPSGTIPFTMDSNGNEAFRSYSGGKMCSTVELRPSLTYPYTYQGFINISSEALAAARPGTYTASLNVYWVNMDSGPVYSGETTITLTLTVPEPVTTITLADDADNTAALDGLNGQTLDVTLDGRTLYCDGDWNTLCLPFSVSDLAGTPLDGFTVKELDTETAYDGHVTGLDGTTLYLNFKDATGIEAGKPYLVKKVAVDEESTLTYTATAGTAGTLTQQGYANLVDGNTSGYRWRTSSVPAYCEFHSDAPVYVTGYTLTTGNQSANFDPTAWTLQAKQNEDDAWTVIDSRNVSENASDALPSGRTAGKAYTIQQPGAYQYFRFDVAATTDGNILCLTELTLNAKHLATGADIVNPTFIDVTVSDEEPTPIFSADGKVSFTGTYSPVTFEADSKNRLYIDDDNNFCWPKEASYTLNAFRAYFELSGIGVNELSDVVNNVGLNFEGETTGIVNVNDNETLRYENENYWYSLDGGKLSEKPTAKGVYIHNGVKVVIF